MSELPDGWAWASLDELGSWTGGGTPKKSVSEYWNGGVPWVSPKDMKQTLLADTRDHISETALEESAAKVFPANSIAFVVRSGILQHTLPVALVPFEATANQDMKVLTPVPTINPRWLLYALTGAAPDIREHCRKDGTTVASIDFPKLKLYRLGVPPRPEQDRIVSAIEARMTEVEGGLRELDEAERGLSEFRASVLAAAVTGGLTGSNGEDERAEASENGTETALPRGWTWATVEQLASLVQYGSSSKTSSNGGGIPVLRMGNIADGRLRLDDLKYLPADHEEFPDLLLRKGDVLFNRTNSPELVGKAAMFRGEPEPCSFASYLIRVRLIPRYRPELLVYFLTSALGRAWVRSVVSQQVGQANVNGTKLKQLRVPVPPVEEQETICRVAQAHLETVDEMRATSLLARASAKGLRRAMLETALHGDLVPHNQLEGTPGGLRSEGGVDS